MRTVFSDRSSVFQRAHECWRRGDFAGFLACLDDDIVYIVNIDGQQVPYAMSSLGKQDVKDRLELLLRTLTVDLFDVEKHMVQGDHEVSVVHGVYSHKRTGEVLDVKVRFKGWTRNGRLVRIEEIQDAKYVEAFERFVYFMQQAAADPFDG